MGYSFFPKLDDKFSHLNLCYSGKSEPVFKQKFFTIFRSHITGKAYKPSMKLYTLLTGVTNLISGGLDGYSLGNFASNKNTPETKIELKIKHVFMMYG